MAIVKKDIRTLKDRNGGLGKVLLTNTDITLVYRVKYIAQYCNSNVNIVNTSNSDASVKLWITRNDEPDIIDLVESGIVLKKDAVYVRTNMVIGPDEAVFVQSDTPGVICRVEGFENNLL